MALSSLSARLSWLIGPASLPRPLKQLKPDIITWLRTSLVNHLRCSCTTERRITACFLCGSRGHSLSGIHVNEYIAALNVAEMYVLLGVLMQGQPARWALWATQLMALAGIGVGVGFTLVPSMPHMLHGLRAASVSNPSEAAAGLFNFAYNAGECLGPLLGGVLTAALGFQMASAVVATATAMLLMAVLLVPSHPPANRLFGYSGSDSWPAAERDRAG
jgi:hypothetical protein